MTPDLALAASAREWPDRLHRHLLDHGGGRVVQRVMSPDQVSGARFDALLIDDISSFLTPRLVTLVKRAGCQVIGVFDARDGPDAKRRLLECGISDVVESQASADEFLNAVQATLAHGHEPIPAEHSPLVTAWSIAVTGVSDGVGSTEVAVGLARALSSSLDTVLADLDPVWPSIAPRLDLSLHPNLRTAVDAVLHDTKGALSGLHRLGELSIVGGTADHGTAGPISHTEIAMLVDVLASSFEVLVADLGAFLNAYGALIGRFDSIALVGSGDPVGLARLLRAVDRLLGIAEEGSLVIVINKTPRGRYHGSEIRAELAAAHPKVPTILVPFDRRVTDSMWQGTASRRGSFAKALRRMTGVIEDSLLR